MALKTHPEGAEGVYEDNLPRVAGAKVEIRKAKKDEDRMGSRGEGRGKEKKTDFFIVFENIGGRTRFEGNTTTVLRQRRQKCLLVFLNVHRIIRKRTEDTVVALHPESI